MPEKISRGCLKEPGTPEKKPRKQQFYKKKPLAEKDIRILFTIDASQDHVELTGERIISTVTPDDTDIINYIHDILYELTCLLLLLKV